jgi:predicted CXXCH cytochrome family protein
MRALVVAVAAVLAALAAPALGGPEGCVVCHGAERVLLEKSVHGGADVSCTTCHGGDPTAVDSKEAAHAAAKGYRGKIPRQGVAEACGTCHADVQRMRPFGLRTDALAAYRTSHHGKSMLEKGVADAATCVDCHGVHDVLRVKDPLSPSFRTNVPATCGRCHADDALMKRHGVETHAVADYAGSVHGVRLARGEPGVPTCADCHDAHAATPPGATEVADVCGSCHRETRDRFRESPHFDASRRGSMHQCVTCHGNHAVKRPDFGLFDSTTDAADDGRGGARCLSCHDPAKPEDRGARTAVALGRGLREAEAAVRDAASRVDAVEAEGFHVDDEREAIDKARRGLVRTVPLAHTVDLARVEAELRRVRSFAKEALTGCDGIVRRQRDRRIFGGVAGVVLLGVAGVLALRRRAAVKP